jgi:hypothetical protein
MKMTRTLKSAIAPFEIVFLLVSAGSALNGTAQTPTPSSPAAQLDTDSIANTQFPGVTFTEDQKAELRRMNHVMEGLKASVQKDKTLSTDQRDQMLAGYSRLEATDIYRMLTADQKRELRARAIRQKQKPQPQQHQ